VCNAISFGEWIAAIDLLCQAAWQVEIYDLPPQPWRDWYAAKWSPERVIMELSTPATPADPEGEDYTLLDRPIYREE
jgi:hypothetical protein